MRDDEPCSDRSLEPYLLELLLMLPSHSLVPAKLLQLLIILVVLALLAYDDARGLDRGELVRVQGMAMVCARRCIVGIEQLEATNEECDEPIDTVPLSRKAFSHEDSRLSSTGPVAVRV